LSVLATFLIEGNHLRTGTMNCAGLRFNCRKCGTLCCRLGGPVVNEMDLIRLSKSVPDIDRITKTIAIGSNVVTLLTNKSTGECILFTERNKREGVCSNYRDRPDVCRTYPFEFVREESTLIVRVLPCRGLNYRKGRLIDEEFVQRQLGSAIAT
jgi:Fe-S-cluster containining protein